MWSANKPMETGDMSPPEEVPLDADQRKAYQEAEALLHTPATFLAPLFSVVKVQQGLPPPSDSVASTNLQERASSRNPFHTDSAGSSPSRPSWFSDAVSLTRNQPLQEALRQLEGLEKEELRLVERSDLSRTLTQALTEEVYSDTAEALTRLTVLGQLVPRRVCQHPFRKNDIVWVCRTCQADETCVLCHACFSQSDHEGHDVNFYHAQAGGCCDCGDPDAWDPAGFCPFHGPNAVCTPVSGSGSLPPSLLRRVHGVVPAVVDWMVQVVAANAEIAYGRSNPEKSAGNEIDSDIEIMDIDYEDVATPRVHVFSPAAASLPKAHRSEAVAQNSSELALSIGQAGAKGKGLFLVLHADDIHMKPEVVDALRSFWGATIFVSDTMLNRMVDALKQYGQLIIWGSAEIFSELSAAQAHLWMDGDSVTCTRVGDMVLERANRLSKHNMFTSILTYDELVREQQAVGVLQWLSIVARSCDPLCQAVAECILPNRHLVPLLSSDFKMSSRVTKAWYSLLLTLLAVPTFKSHLAAAYCDTYRSVTAKYARGMGVLERSGYTLSVQFLNRVTYVIDLVQGRDLLGKLGKSLLETLVVATKSKRYNGRLNPNHFVLAHRRYSPCVSDLKCVLNVPGMPRVTACSEGTFLSDWIATLSVAQFMDPQHWRHWSQGHVEDESRGWVGAFNASISLGSLFERLLGWKDDDESPIKNSASPLARNLMSCVQLTYHVLTEGVGPWQAREAASYEATPFSSSIPPHKRCPRSLPFSTVSAKKGTALAMQQLPVSQMTPFSFHLPLHRFAASAIRELCLRDNSEEMGMENLKRRLRMHSTSSQDASESLFRGLMEFPLLVLSRVAQVRSDLWRRNGPGLNDQVLNYAEPPFCRNMKDADLLMTQLAVLCRSRCLGPSARPESDVGMAFLSNLLLHRLGLFDFVGFFMAPNSNIEAYQTEVATGLYPPESAAPEAFASDMPLPWTYSPARDSSTSMKLLEEYLHFIIVFITELPPVVPGTRSDQTAQAKHRLFREVVHRLASGPKTHSELSEVHHVLSHWDNVLLSEDGKLLNPDDATGAALGTVLKDVADRRISRGGKPEPDKWELRRSAWESYDPAFFHISLRHHQTAAENRPKPKADPSGQYKWEPKPFSPPPCEAHPFFLRLRRDATADACVIAVAYRVLHIHCRRGNRKDFVDLRGRDVYESREMSETALARAVHVLSLGLYAWLNAVQSDVHWREKGGGSAGSMFFDWNRGEAPTVEDWISACLLSTPDSLLDCDWYDGEENALLLLHRLAKTGGESNIFVAQDMSIRAGAAWICATAARHCAKAAALVVPSSGAVDGARGGAKVESEIERRKRMAKEKALARMNAQAAKFASMMEVKIGETNEVATESAATAPSTPNRPIRAGSFGSTYSSASSISMAQGDIDASNVPNFVSLASEVGNMDLANMPQRLLHSRPKCIICNDEDAMDGRPIDRMDHDDDGESQRKRSRRRSENALGFVGYAQASTALKGGGGPPRSSKSPYAPAHQFVGTHVALCGHAVHFECCESYLATVSHREDRAIAKRDEFRCPLCQRLSNCLVPFIDVGVDWVEKPTARKCPTEDGVESMVIENDEEGKQSLQQFLEETWWWVARHSNSFFWDGHSAFVDKLSFQPMSDESPTKRPARKIRSLKKKDLYAAWNAMMRTPRYVRRRLRPKALVAGRNDDTVPHGIGGPTSEDSSGETLVWRRYMDQISEISYKADGKRLGDERLHSFFGEFRHFVVEKHAYNTLLPSGARRDAKDWPACMFEEALVDTRRQELSREKSLSKFFMTVESFTYSCCCENFDAKRAYTRCRLADESRRTSLIEAMFSRYGISRFVYGGRIMVLPEPDPGVDGGEQPFDGRLGKLRYLGLAIMSAAGAVPTDLVQLSLQFPTDTEFSRQPQHGTPLRAPIVFPLLLGHVMTHTVASVFGACGLARAHGDSIDTWQLPPPSQEGAVHTYIKQGAKRVNNVVGDCEGFTKLGFIARVQQTLLSKMNVSPFGVANTREVIASLDAGRDALAKETSGVEREWIVSCISILKVCFTAFAPVSGESIKLPTVDQIRGASSCAAAAACSFLTDICTILQVVIPGVSSKLSRLKEESFAGSDEGVFLECHNVMKIMGMEGLGALLASSLSQQIITHWYTSACEFSASAVSREDNVTPELRARLRRTHGFHHYDWPSAGSFGVADSQKVSTKSKVSNQDQPHHDVYLDRNLVAPETPERRTSSATDLLRHEPAPVVVAVTAKKSVPLLGGFVADGLSPDDSPRVLRIPTSYTDLYAELGKLMPECEQTAVCLICGAVLNAGGKGECTKHSYKCGAGSGMFFLLQECTGLIMHKSKAAYIHSPYVDSHGETPQYRGRPLNLDLDRYDHLREVWFGHGVRQLVVAERGSSRQVILPDFY